MQIYVWLVRSNFGGLATIPLCLKLSHYSSEILIQIFASPFQTQIHTASYFHRNTTSQHYYFGGTTKIRSDIKTHLNLNICSKAQIKLKRNTKKIRRNGDLLMDFNNMFCSLSVLLLRIFNQWHMQIILITLKNWLKNVARPHIHVSNCSAKTFIPCLTSLASIQ